MLRRPPGVPAATMPCMPCTPNHPLNAHQLRQRLHEAVALAHVRERREHRVERAVERDADRDGAPVVGELARAKVRVDGAEHAAGCDGRNAGRVCVGRLRLRERERRKKRSGGAGSSGGGSGGAQEQFNCLSRSRGGAERDLDVADQVVLDVARVQDDLFVVGGRGRRRGQMA